MEKRKKLIEYILPYWKLGAFNIFFGLLSTIFTVTTTLLGIPFLRIMFQKGQERITELPEFALEKDTLIQFYNYYMGSIVEERGAVSALIFVSILLVISSFLKNGFRYLAFYFMAPMRNNVVRDIRRSIYRKAIGLPIGYFSESRKGDLMSRMTNDVYEVEASIMSSLGLFFQHPITVILLLVTLFAMNVKLTLVVLISLPFTGFLIGRLGKSLKKKSKKGQFKLGEILNVIEEMLSGLRIIKAFNAEGFMNDRFDKTNNEYTRLMNRIFKKRYLSGPISEFFGTIVMIIIMVYGTSLVLKGEMTSEVLITYLLGFFQVIAPSKAISTAYMNIQKGMASVDRINNILDAENKITEKKNANSLNSFESSIEYKNVSFKYNDSYVLKNVNIKIEKGKSVALVGHSGSGKSTLVDLLPRFWDIEEGEILIDGHNIKDIKIKDLRDLMGNVNQEAILFNDTIHNNIAFGLDKVTENEVVSAAKVANAHDFITATPDKYNNNIGDRGNKLSGGQRQRLSIARAVMKNPPILILDEATSALDTESERLVQDAIINLMKNRTSIVIAHRLSTIMHADEIFVLNDGVIVEHGKHDALLKMNGTYKKLYDIQFNQ